LTLMGEHSNTAFYIILALLGFQRDKSAARQILAYRSICILHSPS
jgi:hypothetical protein